MQMNLRFLQLSNSQQTWTGLPPPQCQFPDYINPNNIIAPAWGNYDSFQGSILYASGGIEPNRFFVVEWSNILAIETNELVSFQVILHESQSFLLNYKSGTSSQICIGLQKNQTYGLSLLSANISLSAVSVITNSPNNVNDTQLDLNMNTSVVTALEKSITNFSILDVVAVILLTCMVCLVIAILAVLILMYKTRERD